MGKAEDQVVDVMQESGRPMTLIEIAEQLGKPPKKVYSSLRKLFEKGIVNCDVKSRTYQLNK